MFPSLQGRGGYNPEKLAAHALQSSGQSCDVAIHWGPPSLCSDAVSLTVPYEVVDRCAPQSFRASWDSASGFLQWFEQPMILQPREENAASDQSAYICRAPCPRFPGFSGP